MLETAYKIVMGAICVGVVVALIINLVLVTTGKRPFPLRHIEIKLVDPEPIME